MVPVKGSPMALPSMPARVFGAHVPTSVEESEADIVARLSNHLQNIRERQAEMAGEPYDFDVFAPPAQLPEADRARIKARAHKLWEKRKQQLNPIAHLKSDERKLMLSAASSMTSSSVVTNHQVDEIIAALHANYPWMAKASVAVMQHMRLRTAAGPAPPTCPPLILLGAPGIAKSSWARDLGLAFGLTQIRSMSGPPMARPSLSRASSAAGARPRWAAS